MLRRRKIAAGLFMSLVVGLFSLTAPQAPVAAVAGGWEAMGTGTAGGTRGQVMDIAVTNDGSDDVYIGGWFASAGGVANTAYVAKWDGSAWVSIGNQAWGTPGSAVGARGYGVCAVELDDPTNPTRLYVGSDLGGIGTATSDYAAYATISASPVTWGNIDGLGTNRPEYCPEEIVAVGPRDIYMAGSSTLGSNYLIRYDATSSAASAFPASSGFSGRAFGLAYDGTNLYATGKFVSTSATPRLQVNGVAKTTLASPQWVGLGNNPTTSAMPECSEAVGSKYCTEIAVDSSGRVFVGGDFTKVSNSGADTAATGLAMWDSQNGWTSIGSFSGNYPVVEEVKVIGDYLYVGGRFDCVGDRRMNNMARYHIANQQWEAVGDGTRAGVQLNGQWGAVRSIEPVAGSTTSMYVGGAFSDAGGIAGADGIAKLTPFSTPAGPCNPEALETRPVLNIPAPSNFRWAGLEYDKRGGKNGYLVTLAWDPAPSFYIFKVSTQRAESKCIKDQCEYIIKSSHPDWDCWSVSNTCKVFMPFSSNGGFGLSEALFTLRGFTFDGVGGTATVVPPDPNVPATPPGPPTNVVATALEESVRVTWNTPADQGTYPVTNYLVQAAEAGKPALGNVCISRLNDPVLEACTFTSLKPGIQYTFTVRGLNGGGWGTRSVASNQVSPVDLSITSNTRSKRTFLGFNLGSTVNVQGVAPGVAPSTPVTVWVQWLDANGNPASNWEAQPRVSVDRSGKFSFKGNFPRAKNGQRMKVKVQMAGTCVNSAKKGYESCTIQSNEVTLNRV
jgi:hypothetical protein